MNKLLLLILIATTGCTSFKGKRELNNRSNYSSINSIHRAGMKDSGLNYKKGEVKTIYMSGRLLPSNDWFHGGFIDMVIKGHWK